MVSSTDCEQTWSKTLFGNRFMLRLAEGIMDSTEEFTGTQLASLTQIPGSTVHRLLVDLTVVGLVSRQPVKPDSRAQYFTRSAHPFWEAVAELTRTAREKERRSRTLTTGMGRKG